MKKKDDIKPVNQISDEDWDKPLVCPIDPEQLKECEACQ